MPNYIDMINAHREASSPSAAAPVFFEGPKKGAKSAKSAAKKKGKTAKRAKGAKGSAGPSRTPAEVKARAERGKRAKASKSAKSAAKKPKSAPKKKQRSPAQKEATARMLAARAASKAKPANRPKKKSASKPLTKPAASRSTSSAQSRNYVGGTSATRAKGPTMAGKSKGKKKPRTKAQKEATKRMLAGAAKARGEGGDSKKPKKAKASKAAKKPKRRIEQTTAIVRPGKKTQTIKVVMAAESPKKKGGGKKGKGGAMRRKGAMENALETKEIFVGGGTLLIGFLFGDFVDRMIATHALTASATPDPNGTTIYTDTPTTNGSAYDNLYNAAAVAAPMNGYRWLAALGGPFVLLGAARYGIRNATGRAALQFFAFGWLARGVGKGLVDLSAKLFGKYGTGQRIYDAEIRAAWAKSNNSKVQTMPTGAASAAGQPSGIPTSGLGAADVALLKGLVDGVNQQAAATERALAAMAAKPAPAPAAPQRPAPRAPQPSGFGAPAAPPAAPPPAAAAEPADDGEEYAPPVRLVRKRA